MTGLLALPTDPLLLAALVLAVAAAAMLAVGAALLLRDIRGRKRAEAERNRLATFPEENPNPVIEFSTRGAVTYLNPAARAKFPQLADDPADHPVIRRALEAVAKADQAPGQMLVQELGLGEAMYEMQIFLVKDQSVVRVYMTDITARKRLETAQQRTAQELMGTNEALQHREQGTRSLLEDLESAKQRIEQQAERLKAANVKLMEMAALKDEFIAKASHELRTPLTSIKEGLNLLLDNALGETTEEQQDFLKTMDGDVDRLTELINNMLDISKIEAGRLRLVRRRVSLGLLVDSLVRSYRALIGSRVVRTESADVPPVFADSNRMIQVLSNLFSNALKFIREDGRVTFRLERREEYVCVAVEDDGPGIAAEDLGKLFQRFSQVGPVGGGRSLGTGLGLVVCKELTELHGGRIEVVSQVGRGTTFTVLLPVYSDAFALRESFREMLGLAVAEGDGSVAVVAIDVAALLRAGPAPSSASTLEEQAELVRQHVHRGDIVLAIEPSWVVVLAATDGAGCRAIAMRLRGTLLGGEQLRFGQAVYPQDGQDAVALFERASKMVDQDPGAGRPASKHEGQTGQRPTGTGGAILPVKGRRACPPLRIRGRRA